MRTTVFALALAASVLAGGALAGEGDSVVPLSRPLLALDGSEVRLTDFEDRNVVVSFTIVNCTQICLTSDLVMDQVAARARAQGKDVTLLTLTLDPLQDTPELLAHETRERGLDADRTFLTGTFSNVVSVLASIGIHDRSIEGHPVMFLVKRKGERAYRKIERSIGPETIVGAL